MPENSSFVLASPWFLLLALLIPALSLLRGRNGAVASITFSSIAAMRPFGANVAAKAGRWHWAWTFIPLALCIVGLSRPQLARTYEEIKESGIEMIVAIDISRSMDADDFAIGGRRATRLSAAKKVTRDFIQGRPTDRIGLVAFAGRPYLASPLTMDHDWLIESMLRLHSGMTEEGTAIGSAVAASARRLDQSDAKSKVVVLLTDGSNNSGNLTPQTAAELAKTLGIRVYTIAVGTHGLTRIPLQRGSVVRKEFDEQTLIDIADTTNGKYFKAQDTSALAGVFAAIDELEKTEVNRKTVVEAKELYPWFVAAAVAGALFLFISRDTFARSIP
ncbi:MAG: VWA domain-containing protein [Verrucomicrobiota bacterium]